MTEKIYSQKNALPKKNLMPISYLNDYFKQIPDDFIYFTDVYISF